jgi:hypothetical protein
MPSTPRCCAESGFSPMSRNLARPMLGARKEVEMTTISHEPPAAVRPWWLAARDMWASLAISVIWLAVMLDSLFGPDIHTNDAGGNTTTIPSGVVLGLFAVFATMAVAKHGFGNKSKES